MESRHSTQKHETKHQKPDHENTSKRKRSNLLINLVVVGFILVMLLLLILFALNSKSNNPAQGCTGAECTTPTPSGETPTPTEISKYGCGDQGTASRNRIAYVKDNNIWIVNNDGSGKTQVTGDGGDDLVYTSVDWCSSNILTYSKCSNSNCTVINHKLDDASNQTLFATDKGINRVRWSHDGTILASIGGDTKLVWRINLFKDSNTIIKTFKPTLGRGVGLEDGLSLEWSPDDSFLLSLNTFINDPNEDPIQVYQRDGSMLSSAPLPATQPTFADASGYYYYKADNDINRQKISGGAWSLVFSGVQQGHNFAASRNGKYIAYWSFDGNTISLNAYEVGKDVKPISGNLSNPVWLNKDDKDLVALKTSPDSNSPDGISSSGLVKVNRESGAVTKLDDSKSIFSVVSER
jgi:hypothetical protein